MERPYPSRSGSLKREAIHPVSDCADAPIDSAIADGQAIAAPVQTRCEPPLGKRLSRREQEIATLAATGLCNKDIARRLSIAEGTVKLHLHRIFEKLAIKDRKDLACHASAMALPHADSKVCGSILLTKNSAE